MVDEDKNLGAAVVDRKTEQGFTPGPWKVAPSGFFEGVCVRTEDNTWVAQVWAAHRGTELPRDANARLIAAAPAMYEALRKCQTYVDHHTHEKRGLCGSLLDTIDAALSLADTPADESAKRPISDRGTDGQASETTA